MESQTSFEIDDQGKNPVAGVVIKDEEGRYLLIQEKKSHTYGLWNLPAGRRDENESLQKTAVREAKEEVGYDIELIDDQPLLSAQDKDENNRSLTSFRARVVGGELMIQEGELLDAKWLTIEEIKALDKAGKIRDPWVTTSILIDANL